MCSMKNLASFRILCLSFICSLAMISSAQTAATVPSTIDTSAKKSKHIDYTHLLSQPEFDTKIYGKVNRSALPGYTELYPKGQLFGDSFSKINNGALVELLNTDLPMSKTSHRILVKVISNPPMNKDTGNIGWMLVDHTTLLQFLDEPNRRIDTNMLRNKYTSGAAKLREDAQKTTCPANKKCNLQWAAYYDCMAKGKHYDSPPACPLVNCTIEDCPGDNK
jgi:hypothetical protein